MLSAFFVLVQLYVPLAKRKFKEFHKYLNLNKKCKYHLSNHLQNSPSLLSQNYKKMEEECGSFNLLHYYQEEGIEELKHSLLDTTLELESAVVFAHEELPRKEDELMHLKSLLNKTIKERNEAQENCRRLTLEKLILQQKLQPSPITISDFEDELTMKGDSATGISYSGCDENFTPSPRTEQIPLPLPVQPLDVTDKLVINKTLPENGKFLKAVMEAGPLLQTVLLAGPLPQWQHPPPQLNSCEIPPVTIPSPGARVLIHQDYCLGTSGCFSKKRV